MIQPNNLQFYLTALLFVFGFNLYTLSAQEQISNIIGEGVSQRQVLHEHQGSDYILSVDVLDSLKVYEYIDGESVLLHSRHYTGLQNEYTFNVADGHLFLDDVRGSIAYNFVDDEEWVFEYKDSLSQTSWFKTDSIEIKLKQYSRDNDIYRSMLINLVDHSIQEFDTGFLPLDYTEDYVLLREYIGDQLFNFYVYDRLTNEKTFIVTTYLYGRQSVFENDAFTYWHDGKVLRYNLSTGIQDTLIETSEFEYSRVIIRATENHYVLTYTYLDLTFLRTINKSNLKSTITLQDLRIEEVFYEEIDNNIIMDDGYDMYNYNLGSEILTEINSYFEPEDTRLLADRYLFGAYDSSYRLYDIYTNTYIGLGVQLEDVSVKEMNFIETDDYILFNIDHNERSHQDLWKISIADGTMLRALDIIPTIKMGVEDRGAIISAGNELFLVEKNIYKVSANTVDQLNIGSIISSKVKRHRVIGDHIYWIENINEAVIICGYIDGQRKEIVTTPQVLPLHHYQIVGVFSVTDDYVFFVNRVWFVDSLVRIDRETGDWITIVENSLFSGEIMFTHNNNTYLRKGNLYYIDLDGALVDLDINTGSSTLPASLVFNDDLYYATSSGVFRIDGSQTERVIELTDGWNFSLFQWGEYMVTDSGSGSKDFYFTEDGDEWSPVVVNDDRRVDFLGEGYIALQDRVDTNRDHTTMYNVTTGDTLVLPVAFREFSYESVYRHAGRDVAVAYSLSNVSYKIHLIQLDVDSADVIQLAEFESGGGNSSFSQDGGDGFLYAGNNLFVVNQDFMLQDLGPNIYGDAKATDIALKDGYFYFLAFHPTLGRQVYRLMSDGTLTSTDNVQSNSVEVTVMPNPADHYVVINLPDTDQWTYHLLSAHGMEVSVGIYQNHIDISTLQKGAYFVVLNNSSGERRVAKFIKQ